MAVDLYSMIAGAFGSPTDSPNQAAQRTAVEQTKGAFGMPAELLPAAPNLPTLPGGAGQSGNSQQPVANIPKEDQEKPGGWFAKYGRLVLVGAAVALGAMLVWKFFKRKG